MVRSGEGTERGRGVGWAGSDRDGAWMGVVCRPGRATLGAWSMEVGGVCLSGRGMMGVVDGGRGLLEWGVSDGRGWSVGGS